METQKRIVDAKRVKETGLVVETSLEIRLFNDENNLVDRAFMNAQLDGEPSAEDFIPFEDLTVEKLMEWTVSKLTQEAIDAKEQELTDRYNERVQEQEENPFENGLPNVEEPFRRLQK